MVMTGPSPPCAFPALPHFAMHLPSVHRRCGCTLLAAAAHLAVAGACCPPPAPRLPVCRDELRCLSRSPDCTLPPYIFSAPAIHCCGLITGPMSRYSFNHFHRTAVGCLPPTTLLACMKVLVALAYHLRASVRAGCVRFDSPGPSEEEERKKRENNMRAWVQGGAPVVQVQCDGGPRGSCWICRRTDASSAAVAGLSGCAAVRRSAREACQPPAVHAW